MRALRRQIAKLTRVVHVIVPAHDPDRPQSVEESGGPREPEPSIINEKTIADFTRVVEQGI